MHFAIVLGHTLSVLHQKCPIQMGFEHFAIVALTLLYADYVPSNRAS
jgi:hypothetical protein